MFRIDFTVVVYLKSIISLLHEPQKHGIISVFHFVCTELYSCFDCVNLYIIRSI